MEVIQIRIFKEMGFSLNEVGVPTPLNRVLGEDLLLLESFVRQKAKSEEKKFKK